MKALQIDRFGPLESLQVREVPEGPLPSDSVRIAIEAAGVNPSDTGVALGRFAHATLPRVLGRDFAGIVIEGPAHLKGLRVWGSGGGILGMTRDGSHAEHMVLTQDAVITRPSRLSAQEAAAAGVPYVTAWSALVELGDFKAGQWAIVSGAAGAVGSAAVALTKALGGHAIALVLSTSDRAPLDAMGVDALLRSDADDVPKAVAELTSGRGADVALNGVGAPVFSMLSDSLAKGGRMVIFSARSGGEVRLDLFAFYRRRLQLYGLDTAGMTLAQIAQLFVKFGPLFESGALAPPPIAARFSLARAREAYERVGQGLSGKVVLIPGAREAEPAAESAAEAARPSKRDAASAAAPA
jgi:NADPH2:quinone reductase